MRDYIIVALTLLAVACVWGGAFFLGKWMAGHKGPYDFQRWDEMSVEENQYVADCVLFQSYEICIDNVGKMRNLGSVPAHLDRK